MPSTVVPYWRASGRCRCSCDIFGPYSGCYEIKNMVLRTNVSSFMQAAAGVGAQRQSLRQGSGSPQQQLRPQAHAPPIRSLCTSSHGLGGPGKPPSVASKPYLLNEPVLHAYTVPFEPEHAPPVTAADAISYAYGMSEFGQVSFNAISRTQIVCEEWFCCHS